MLVLIKRSRENENYFANVSRNLEIIEPPWKLGLGKMHVLPLF